MAFTIEGITVSLGSLREDRLRVGENSIAFSGRVLKQERAQARVFNIETNWLSAADADALRMLIEGRGHQWSGASVYASSGMAFVAGHALTFNASGGKFLPYFSVGAGNSVASTGFASGVTVTFWGIGSAWFGDGNWHHVAVTKTVGGTVTKYVDGVSSVADLPISISGGDVTILGTAATSGKAVSMSDFVVLDGVAGSTWPATWNARNTQTSALPKVALGGEFPSMYVLGEVKSSEFRTVKLNGTLQVAQRLSATLTEVL